MFEKKLLSIEQIVFFYIENSEIVFRFNYDSYNSSKELEKMITFHYNFLDKEKSYIQKIGKNVPFFDGDLKNELLGMIKGFVDLKVILKEILDNKTYLQIEKIKKDNFSYNFEEFGNFFSFKDPNHQLKYFYGYDFEKNSLYYLSIKIFSKPRQGSFVNPQYFDILFLNSKEYFLEIPEEIIMENKLKLKLLLS